MKQFSVLYRHVEDRHSVAVDVIARTADEARKMAGSRLHMKLNHLPVYKIYGYKQMSVIETDEE